MIIIRQNTKNQIVLTLRERQCVHTKTYLLKFTDVQSNAEFFAIVEDKSPSPERYQLFCVDEIGSGTPDPSQGEVLLKYKGQYHYTAYANPDSVLDPSCLNECETGKLEVTGVIYEPTTYQSTPTPITVWKNPATNN
jgi:hypothetical protein